MTDDFVNDPFDEAPVHVLDDDAEPDASDEGGENADDEGAPESSPSVHRGASGEHSA